MRARLLVVVLMLFVLSAGSLQAAGFGQGGSSDNAGEGSSDLLPLLADAELIDPSTTLMQTEQSQPDTDQQDQFAAWIEAKEESRQLQWVYPPDERVQASPAASQVALIALSFWDGDVLGQCTGTFIGPRVVLTAAHCLYDHTYGWIDFAAVVPGKDGSYDPYGHVYGANYYVPVGWTESTPQSAEGTLYDMGLIIL